MSVQLFCDTYSGENSSYSHTIKFSHTRTELIDMPNYIKQKELIIFLFFYPQPLVLLPCLLAAATGAPQLLVGAGVCGQVSHQSVSKPLQGESRSTVQSKALGSGIASVSDSPNRLHGARRVVSAPVATPVFSSSPIVQAAPLQGCPCPC